MSANPLLGQVAIRIGDRDLTIEYSVHAIIMLEKLLGMKSKEIAQRIATDNSIEFLRAWFWGGLIEHQPEFDLASDPISGEPVGLRIAGELLRQPGSQNVFAVLYESWVSSWPRPVIMEGDKGPPERRPTRAAPDGTGTTFSVTGSSIGSGLRASFWRKLRGFFRSPSTASTAA